MFDKPSTASINKASGKPAHQTKAMIQLTKQQRARDRALFYRFKFERLWHTLCRHRGKPRESGNPL
jgi:hypothetical protein